MSILLNRGDPGGERDLCAGPGAEPGPPPGDEGPECGEAWRRCPFRRTSPDPAEGWHAHNISIDYET